MTALRCFTRCILPAICPLLLITGALPAAESVPAGMAQLYRLDLLPALRESVYVGSVSSYDRTGGNDDGFSGNYSFVAKEGDSLVLADLKGPGIIYRIWTPTPTDDTLEFYLPPQRNLWVDSGSGKAPRL